MKKIIFKITTTLAYLFVTTFSNPAFAEASKNPFAGFTHDQKADFLNSYLVSNSDLEGILSVAMKNYDQKDSDFVTAGIPKKGKIALPTLKLKGEKIQYVVDNKKFSIVVLDISNQLFEINGKSFQFNDSVSVEENIKKLNSVLAPKSSGLFDLFVPKAQAALFVPALIALGVVAWVSIYFYNWRQISKSTRPGGAINYLTMCLEAQIPSETWSYTKIHVEKFIDDLPKIRGKIASLKAEKDSKNCANQPKGDSCELVDRTLKCLTDRSEKAFQIIDSGNTLRNLGLDNKYQTKYKTEKSHFQKGDTPPAQKTEDAVPAVVR
jgi:hypothetical protein